MGKDQRRTLGERWEEGAPGAGGTPRGRDKVHKQPQGASWVEGTGRGGKQGCGWTKEVARCWGDTAREGTVRGSQGDAVGGRERGVPAEVTGSGERVAEGVARSLARAQGSGCRGYTC